MLSMLKDIVKTRFPSYVAVLRKLRDDWSAPGLQGLSTPAFSYDERSYPPRLNLVLPPIGRGSLFGGLLTAFALVGRLVKPSITLRLVVTGKCIPKRDLSELVRSYADLPADADIEVVTFSNDGYRLPISSRDRYICTTWRTAYLIQHMVESFQKGQEQDMPPIVYLIQDYEPGFYPWSSEYVLARSTYEWSGTQIPVFNSSDLYEYFRSRHKVWGKYYIIEPTYSSALLASIRSVARKKISKEKIILFYGRPNTPRNAFELGVESLKRWAQQYPQAKNWKVVSVGEPYKRIDLSEETFIESAGKLDINEYAEILLRSAVGLSLMISPHPSYPPLEMASCGVRVLTNAFDGKEWSQAPENLHVAKGWEPDVIATELSDLCRYEETTNRKAMFDSSLMETPDSAYVFTEDLAKDLDLL